MRGGRRRPGEDFYEGQERGTSEEPDGTEEELMVEGDDAVEVIGGCSEADGGVKGISEGEVFAASEMLIERGEGFIMKLF